MVQPAASPRAALRFEGGDASKLGAVSNAPSAHRHQHAEAIEPPRVDAHAFRPGWRVRTRLDALLADGHITPGAYQSAVQLRGWVERIAHQRVSRSALIRVDVTHQAGGIPVLQLDAATRLRAAYAAIGQDGWALLVACIVDDASWAANGRRYRRNSETMRDWIVTAIEALADCLRTPST